ncbi:hypothetical protein HOL63_01210 [Candidatus Peregrinibacteria bacterium]|jgi:hypothetical protein|nr:hypothetical protein [Candidatus Peregrinibacteria bacterium]MBT5468474.1 hypothetical protein [Candidatus Peregrinibacteria bacterium]MBT7337292.1 hypothetical protein [Candidatus Peregrinibacteria bacterium]
MKKTIIASMALLALTACQNANTSKEQELSYLLENPLFAERYSESMVDTMVELEIYEDPIIKDEAKMKIIDKTKESWLKVAQKARVDQRKGSKGSFTPITEFTAGEVLYSGNSLFLAPDFASAPGPSLHFYLSTVVDPRDVEFPDESAIDLGLMRSNLGTGRYEVVGIEEPIKYRSLVLFDTELERLYGFAQISPLYK